MTMALPPSEEIFRKRILLEAYMKMLQDSITAISKPWVRNKRTTIQLLKKVNSTLLEQRGLVELALTLGMSIPESEALFEKRVKLEAMYDCLTKAIIKCDPLPNKQSVIKYLGDLGKEFNHQWLFLERELERQRTLRVEEMNQHMADIKKTKLN